MAYSSSSSTFKKLCVLVIGLSFLFFAYAPQRAGNINHPLKICKFYQIYQLGDSFSDTGNLVREFPVGAYTHFATLPYGETFFKNATGRCSNGLLMIDYLAKATGLPLLPPYKTTANDFTHGVNFAVAGSTALPTQILRAKNIAAPLTKSSLNVQLEWMSNHFNSICLNDRDCVEKLQTALFMVGQIGTNDYTYAIFQGKTMKELRDMVPEVVNAIMDAVKKVISFGATRVVVSGIFPIGCLPVYQTAFKSSDPASYDGNHCLTHLNDFAKYHNRKLRLAIYKLKQEKPNAIIVYGNYYYAYGFLHRFAKARGFDTQRACCGIGGEFNFNMTNTCGAPNVPVCKDPHRYISWDGVHLTQNGYKIMAGWFLRNIFNKLQCHI